MGAWPAVPTVKAILRVIMLGPLITSAASPAQLASVALNEGTLRDGFAPRENAKPAIRSRPPRRDPPPSPCLRSRRAWNAFSPMADRGGFKAGTQFVSRHRVQGLSLKPRENATKEMCRGMDEGEGGPFENTLTHLWT